MSDDVKAAAELPPGPWQYCPWEHDYCIVRAPDGEIVASILAPMKQSEFYASVPRGSPEAEAGPPKARAIAELMIRAEREADPTPLDAAWLLSVGFKAVPSDMGPEYHDHYQLGRLNLWQFHGAGPGDGEWLVNDADWIAIRTRGQLRRLAACLGITLKETP